MKDATLFLTVENVIIIHDDQIERYGGSHGIAKLDQLESAIMRPQSSFGGEDLHTDLFDKTAAIMHSLVLNHPFVDGNKRTATVTSVVFLELNGYQLLVGNDELIEMALNVVNKKWNNNKLATWFRKNSKRIE